MRNYADIYTKLGNYSVISYGLGFLLCDKQTHKITCWQMFLTAREGVEFAKNIISVDLVIEYKQGVII